MNDSIDDQDVSTEQVSAWQKSELGPVTNIRQQARWRQMWFATVDRNGTLLPVCVRGERSDTELTWPLGHEMRFLDTTVSAGVKAPAVHAWSDELTVFVMDDVPGRPDFDGVGPADSRRIVDE